MSLLHPTSFVLSASDRTSEILFSKRR